MTFFVESLGERNGQKQLWGFTPVPFGLAFAADFPQIKRAALAEKYFGK